jgi:hypothetical protein
VGSVAPRADCSWETPFPENDRWARFGFDSQESLDAIEDLNRFSVTGLAGFRLLGEIFAKIARRAAGVGGSTDEDDGGTVVGCEVVRDVRFGLLQKLVEVSEGRHGCVGLG